MTTLRPSSDGGTTHRPSGTVTVIACAVVVWCLIFAAVNVLQFATGGVSQQPSQFASGVTVMAVLVLVLKLIGAGVALVSIRPVRRPSWLLAATLWGMASLLVLYSLGNVAITIAMVSGLAAPSAAWEAAGGVTGRSVTYLVFFLAAAPLFTTLAVSYHRRLWPDRSAVVAGAIGAPLLLVAVLVAAPAALSALGMLP